MILFSSFYSEALGIVHQPQFILSFNFPDIITIVLSNSFVSGLYEAFCIAILAFFWCLPFSPGIGLFTQVLLSEELLPILSCYFHLLFLPWNPAWHHCNIFDKAKKCFLLVSVIISFFLKINSALPDHFQFRGICELNYCQSILEITRNAAINLLFPLPVLSSSESLQDCPHCPHL